MIYDVLIVGAGPSGSYSAYHLAKKGFKIAIIDREIFPRDKVCGGGISNKTVDLVDFDISQLAQKQISGAFLSYQNKHVVIKDLEGRSGLNLLRSELDNYLLEKAVNNGVVFKSQHNFEYIERRNDSFITVGTNHGELNAKYVFGADGVYSRVRNTWFSKDLVTYTPSLEALVYVKPEVIEKYQNRNLLDFGGMKNGYGWIFPKIDHLNVGVFSIYGSKTIRDELQKFMSMYRSLQSPEKVIYKGHSIPIHNLKHVYEKDNVWLLGDAAGFAESFYGEGIYFALKSAIIASSALEKSFGTKDRLYTSEVKKQMLDDMRYSELNARLFFPMQKFGYYQMVCNKHVNYYFAEIIAGRVSYKECFYKTIATSPYWLFSEKFQFEKGIQL